MKLVTQLKDAGQDFEFYPTTNEIIRALIQDITMLKDIRYDGCRSRGKLESFLDIGAGSGKVLRAVRAFRQPRYEGSSEMVGVLHEFYAIEKSPILCDQLDAEIFIVGTEFHEQNLTSKAIDVTFCNPPYSEFVEWSARIIRESASAVVYLVIPTRWRESELIDSALKFRGVEAEIVGGFSFEDAEDRQARAEVHLLRIELRRGHGEEDAFELFFNQQFKDLKEKFQGVTTRAERNGEKRLSTRTRTSSPLWWLVLHTRSVWLNSIIRSWIMFKRITSSSPSSTAIC